MNPKQIGIGILVVALIVIAVMQFNGRGNQTEQTGNTMETSQPATGSSGTTESAATSEISTMEASTYADGTYQAEGTYTSPAQVESVDVELTLENGVVTAAQFTGNAEHPTSVKLQEMFADGYSEEVVGKSIDQIALTTVNGSSLTPKGFMDAIEKIKAEAAQS